MHSWALGSLGVLPVAGLPAVWLAAGPAAASQAPGTWTKTGSMTTRNLHRRHDHPAGVPHPHRAANGQVLAAGGETQSNVGKFSVTASAERYTP
jgi:hypothetical protein